MSHVHKSFCFALALLGITCTGCDDELSPQHGGAMTVTYRAPGEPWGPCKENCADGFCIHDELGSACFPPCGPICGDIVDACGTVIGNGTCLDSGLCALVCSDTPDCPSGMVCSPNAGLCLWPD